MSAYEEDQSRRHRLRGGVQHGPAALAAVASAQDLHRRGGMRRGPGAARGGPEGFSKSGNFPGHGGDVEALRRGAGGRGAAAQPACASGAAMPQGRAPRGR